MLTDDLRLTVIMCEVISNENKRVTVLCLEQNNAYSCLGQTDRYHTYSAIQKRAPTSSIRGSAPR